LNLPSDILVSKFAFKLNLYRYTGAGNKGGGGACWGGGGGGVRRSLSNSSNYKENNGKDSSAGAADILTEMRRKSPFLRAAEQEAAAHGPAIAALRWGAVQLLNAVDHSWKAAWSQTLNLMKCEIWF
jgi:hypothetical protein